jgi:hypothetical protein
MISPLLDRLSGECDYARHFSQEQAIITEVRMATYFMIEGLSMVRGWLL